MGVHSATGARWRAAARWMAGPYVRVAGTALGVLLLLHGVDLGRAAANLRGADPGLLAVGLALTGVGVLATVGVWGIVIRGIGHHIAWSRLGSWYLQAVFIGHVAPSGAAGDALRVVEVGRVTGHARSLASLAMSRMSTTLATALFGLAGAVLLRSALGVPVVAGAAVYAGFMLAAFGLSLRVHGITRLCQRRTSRLCRFTVRVVGPFTEAFDAARRVPRFMAACVAVGVVGWVVNMVALQVLAASVGVHAGWTVFAVAVPISLLAATAPIAVNGMGLREGVLVGMLAHLGVDPAHAGALAVLVDLQLVPYALAGGALVVVRRRVATRQRAARLAPAPIAA